MAPPQASILSSNVMNTQLKEKQYSTFFAAVEPHFILHPKDHVSAGKLSTAIAYHLYHNPCPDAGIADRMAIVVATAFEVMSLRAESPEKLASEERDKAATASVNILAKGFLREAWLIAAKKTLRPFQHFFKATKDQEMLEFMLQMEACVDTIDAALKKSKDMEKEVRQMLKENRFTVQQTEMKIFYLYHFRLELFFLEKKQTGEILMIPNAVALIKDALNFCQQLRIKIKNLDTATSCEEKVIVLCFRFGALIKSKHVQEASQFFELADRALTDLCKAIPSYVPTSKVLPLYHYFYDLQNDAENWEVAESSIEKLHKILLRIESLSVELSKIASSQYVLAIYRAFTQFSSWRIAYEKLQRQTKVELSNNAKMESAPLLSRDGGAAEDALAVGDSNPYIACLTLDTEEDLFDLAKRAISSFRKAIGHKEKGLSSTSLTSACILRMTLILSEFFKLIGQQEQYIDGIYLLLQSAQEFENDLYQKIAQSVLIRYNLNVDNILVKSMVSSDIKDNFHYILIPAATAWRSFFFNKIDEATQLATSVIKFMAKQRASSTSRLISADMKQLLTLCRCSPESFVIYPASPQRQFPTEDYKGVIENGPLEHICDSFKDATSATHCLSNHKLKNLLWYSEMIRAHATHLEVLCTRTEMYMHIGLPKEMRLYGKLRLEMTQKLALSTRAMPNMTDLKNHFSSRTSDSLLIMAEIDLRCDDPEQALGKLNGVKHILGTMLLENGSAKSKLTKSKSSVMETSSKLAASPALRYSEFSIPSFFQHHLDCNCSKCSNSLLSLVVLRYANLLGVWYHMTEEYETAVTFFEKTFKMVKMLVEKIESKDGAINTISKETAYLDIFNILQWQVECQGRNEKFGQATQLLEEQKNYLSKIPAIVRKFPYLRARYYHQLEFLRKDDITGCQLVSQLATLALSPSIPSPSDISSPSNFKTPIVKARQRLPRKPAKKLLPLP